MARTVLVILGCLFSLTALAVDLERKVDFNIPAQTLSAALIQFSHQAKIQVVISDDISRQTTRGVTGAHTIRQALQQLLEAAGLGYRVVGDQTITIGRGARTTVPTSSATGAPTPAVLSENARAPEESRDSTAGRVVLEEVLVTATKRP